MSYKEKLEGEIDMPLFLVEFTGQKIPAGGGSSWIGYKRCAVEADSKEHVEGIVATKSKISGWDTCAIAEYPASQNVWPNPITLDQFEIE